MLEHGKIFFMIPLWNFKDAIYITERYPSKTSRACDYEGIVTQYYEILHRICSDCRSPPTVLLSKQTAGVEISWARASEREATCLSKVLPKTMASIVMRATVHHVPPFYFDALKSLLHTIIILFLD